MRRIRQDIDDPVNCKSARLGLSISRLRQVEISFACEHDRLRRRGRTPGAVMSPSPSSGARTSGLTSTTCGVPVRIWSGVGRSGPLADTSAPDVPDLRKCVAIFLSEKLALTSHRGIVTHVPITFRHPARSLPSTLGNLTDPSSSTVGCPLCLLLAAHPSARSLCADCWAAPPNGAREHGALKTEFRFAPDRGFSPAEWWIQPEAHSLCYQRVRS